MQLFLKKLSVQNGLKLKKMIKKMVLQLRTISKHTGENTVVMSIGEKSFKGEGEYEKPWKS